MLLDQTAERLWIADHVRCSCAYCAKGQPAFCVRFVQLGDGQRAMRVLPTLDSDRDES